MRRTTKRAAKPTGKTRSTASKAKAGGRLDARDEDMVVRLRAPGTETGAVELRIPEAKVPRFQQMAMSWTYALRNRRRWNDSSKRRAEETKALKEFQKLVGLGEQELTGLWGAVGAAGAVLEVHIRFEAESKDWAARIFPWEFFLSRILRSRRGGRSLTVVRRLVLAKRAAPAPRMPAKPKVLYVESAPGVLGREFSFDDERDIVRTQLDIAKNDDFVMRESPTLEVLARTVAEIGPDVLHFAGFDTHQGMGLVRDLADEGEAGSRGGNSDRRESSKRHRVLDGCLLSTEHGGVDEVSARSLAEAVCGGGNKPPFLVAFNSWNTAARCAPMMVAEGASAAIGFQDSFDDGLAELFFASLYRSQTADWDLIAAFREAWETVRGTGSNLAGSGLVLWLADDVATTAAKVAAAGADGKKSTVPDADALPRDRIAEHVHLHVEPIEELNYALLHNNRPLFKDFLLRNRKRDVPCLRDLHVKVRLQDGDQGASFERSFDATIPAVDLRHEIHVPLTSALLRCAHERINTSLFVEVCWGRHVLHRDTHRVRLLPIDQWRDNESDGMWLPSFVLPRDPAVAKLIDRAQRYVRVLRDDPTAGFEGYQCIVPRSPESMEEVDLQVEAIWALIVHELELGYVNPPPSYASEMDSQRLRTPSMVVADRAGTCIDLTLLFCACLELIDVYAVIFLLEGHAFAGYWRSEEAHQAFMSALPEGEAIGEIITLDKDTNGVAGTDREAWSFGRTAYEEIRRAVEAGDLVPIESTLLTERGSFADARTDGADWLKTGDEFHSMLDIARARAALVTPLPISGAAS